MASAVEASLLIDQEVFVKRHDGTWLKARIDHIDRSAWLNDDDHCSPPSILPASITQHTDFRTDRSIGAAAERRSQRQQQRNSEANTDPADAVVLVTWREALGDGESRKRGKKLSFDQLYEWNPHLRMLGCEVTFKRSDGSADTGQVERIHCNTSNPSSEQSVVLSWQDNTTGRKRGKTLGIEELYRQNRELRSFIFGRRPVVSGPPPTPQPMPRTLRK